MLPDPHLSNQNQQWGPSLEEPRFGAQRKLQLVNPAAGQGSHEPQLAWSLTVLPDPHLSNKNQQWGPSLEEPRFGTQRKLQLVNPAAGQGSHEPQLAWSLTVPSAPVPAQLTLVGTLAGSAKGL